MTHHKNPTTAQRNGNNKKSKNNKNIFINLKSTDSNNKNIFMNLKNTDSSNLCSRTNTYATQEATFSTKQMWFFEEEI